MTSLKGMFASLKKSLISFTMIVMGISITLGIIFFFRFLGLKGFMGFVFGVIVTGFIFMSDNTYIKAWREMTLK